MSENVIDETESVIVCECGENFESASAFEEHFENVHQEPKNEDFIAYKCSVCEELFMTKKLCNSHIRKEHLIEPTKTKNERNIICEVCGKKYSSNAALRYHFRVHTGEKPYHCTLCPKKFTMPLFLQIHMRIHTGEKPYACQLCTKAFTNKAALLRHDRVHTGIKPYPCPKCGKTFTQSNSMKLHVTTVHYKMPSPYKSKARKLKQALKEASLNKQIKVEKSDDEDNNDEENNDEDNNDVKLKIVKLPDDLIVSDQSEWLIDDNKQDIVKVPAEFVPDSCEVIQSDDRDLVKLEIANDNNSFDDGDSDNKVYEYVEISKNDVTVIYSDEIYQVGSP